LKPLVERHNRLLGFTVLLFLLVIQSLILPHHVGSEQSVVTVNYPVSYPLPTVPEPVLVGGPLKVEVDVGPDAGNWAAKLTSDYGSSPLTMMNSSYTEGQGWTLFYEVPATLYPGPRGMARETHDKPLYGHSSTLRRRCLR